MGELKDMELKPTVFPGDNPTIRSYVHGLSLTAEDVESTLTEVSTFVNDGLLEANPTARFNTLQKPSTRPVIISTKPIIVPRVTINAPPKQTSTISSPITPPAVAPIVPSPVTEVAPSVITPKVPPIVVPRPTSVSKPTPLVLPRPTSVSKPTPLVLPRPISVGKSVSEPVNPVVIETKKATAPAPTPSTAIVPPTIIETKPVPPSTVIVPRTLAIRPLSAPKVPVLAPVALRPVSPKTSIQPERVTPSPQIASPSTTQREQSTTTSVTTTSARKGITPNLGRAPLTKRIEISANVKSKEVRPSEHHGSLHQTRVKEERDVKLVQSKYNIAIMDLPIEPIVTPELVTAKRLELPTFTVPIHGVKPSAKKIVTLKPTPPSSTNPSVTEAMSTLSISTASEQAQAMDVDPSKLNMDRKGSYTVAQLRDIARKLGLKGLSTADKKGYIAAIKAALGY